ncbi:MAG: amino acid racemase [Synergistes sp.]|nr:amino acid racemase [Synergistes sp.]
MKTIGIIGGLAWPSTITFYRIINREIAKRLGGNGLHCAKLIIAQTDFHEVEYNQTIGNWDRVGELLGEEAEQLKAAGADFFFIACNTVHAAYEQIIRHTDLPCIHIVDPVGAYAQRNGYGTVGLLGSSYTMDGTFFKSRLQDKYGVQTITPCGENKEIIHSALYRELTRGIVSEDTHRIFVRCIRELMDQGAELIVLGCTEFGLVVKNGDGTVPVIDTTEALSMAAVDLALAE